MPYQNLVKWGYNWISETLYLRLKAVFEPKYLRELEDEEVIQIADSLVNFTETYFKYKSKERVECSS